MEKYKTCNICEDIYMEKVVSVVVLDELKTHICVHCLKKARLNSETNGNKKTDQEIAREAIKSGNFKVGK